MPRIDPSEYAFVTDDYLTKSSPDELRQGLDRLRALSGPTVKDDPKAKAGVRNGIDRIYKELDARAKGAAPGSTATYGTPNAAPAAAPASKPEAKAAPKPTPKPKAKPAERPAEKPAPAPVAKPAASVAAPPAPPRPAAPAALESRADDDESLEEEEDDSETFGEEGDFD